MKKLMKKQWLGLTILLGLAGVVSHAHAVYVNDEGKGEVLLYPYYTVEGGQDTYIAVVNTTNMTKAVRVRLNESMNAAEVLSFNLYLAPFDHWAGVITRDSEGAGGLLKTADTSCTVPAIPAAGTPLHNLYYADLNSSNMNADGGPQGVERTREGFVEVIEMGVLDDGAANSFGAEAAATPDANGVPANCERLRNAWQLHSAEPDTVIGAWSDPTANLLAFAPDLAGGLYGYGVLINPQEGTNATYDAVALSAFNVGTLHAHPNDYRSPHLGHGSPIATIFDRDQLIDLFFFNGLDAVSSVIMHNRIEQDFVLEPSIAAGTDWVVTFPTKRDYVNLNPPAEQPFLSIWESPGIANEQVVMTHWNRNGKQSPWDVAPPGICWVGGPVDCDPLNLRQVLSLRGTANVISFLGPNVDPDDAALEGYSSALYPSARTQVPFVVDYSNGWATVNLAEDAGDVPSDRILTALDGTELYGLPVIGFAVQKYANSTLQGVGNSGAFYSGVSRFKTSREIHMPL